MKEARVDTSIVYIYILPIEGADRGRRVLANKRYSGSQVHSPCRVLANTRQDHIATHPALLPRCIEEEPDREGINSGFGIAKR